MSDPVSATTIAAGGLFGASLFGLATGIDYGVVFGAFAGAVFLCRNGGKHQPLEARRLLHHFIHLRCDWCSPVGVVLLKVDGLQRQAARCTQCCNRCSHSH